MHSAGNRVDVKLPIARNHVMLSVVKSAGAPSSTVGTYLLAAVIAVVAFLFGRFTAAGSKDGTSIDPSKPANARGDIPKATERAAQSEGESVLASAAPLSGEQIRVQTFELLAAPDSFERMRRLCEMIPHVTAENWREFVDAFVRQTATTGRIHNTEWALAMERVGQVAGREAIEEAFASEKSRVQSRAPLLLTGWASTDPKAAQEWFDRLGPDMQSTYAGPFLSGLARKEPSTALELLATRFADNRDALTPQIVDGMVRRGGVREAEEVLLQLRDGSDIPEAVKGSFFGGVAMRQIEMARMQGEPSKVLEWADRYMGPNVAGPKALSSLVTFAAQSDASTAFNWVEAHSGEWTPKQAGSIYPALAARLQSQAPEQFASWMESNPDHPQRESMAIAVARQIAQNGRIDEARQWLELIPDTSKRNTVEQELRKLSAQAQPERVELDFPRAQ
jgi:hypothetical protein